MKNMTNMNNNILNNNITNINTLETRKFEEFINNNVFQIIFFETIDDNCLYPPQTNYPVIAFCPFTKIYARGGDIKEALGNWISEASFRFGFPFRTPSLRSRKIWCNEFKDREDKKHPVYVIDYQFAHSDKAVLFLPDTFEWLQSSDDDWVSLTQRLVEKEEKEVKEKQQGGDDQRFSVWFDDLVTCSDLCFFGRENMIL